MSSSLKMSNMVCLRDSHIRGDCISEVRGLVFLCESFSVMWRYYVLSFLSSIVSERVLSPNASPIAARPIVAIIQERNIAENHDIVVKTEMIMITNAMSTPCDTRRMRAIVSVFLTFSIVERVMIRDLIR